MSKEVEMYVRAAIARVEGGGRVTKGAKMHASRARDLERAHARALAAAQETADEAARIARRLGEEGLGVVVSSDIAERARLLAEALTARRDARETFAASSLVQSMGGGWRLGGR